MTNEQLIQDLKQFIEATVSQHTAHLATKDDLEQGLTGLRQEMHEGFRLADQKLETITEAIGEAHQATEARLDDHHDRIVRLEHRAA